MAEVIGTARIDITSDASGVEAATAKAKASIASMSKDAQAQYSRLSAAEKRRIDGLIRQADTVGMTRAQQIAYNASLKSSGPLLDDLMRRLRATESAAKSTGAQFNQYGLTAKMELAALRQVPAQLTDIIVSLQGGQRPLTVLLQQGGQLRDVFGGIVPAAKAMGGALLGLVNPATLALGAFAALSAAYYTGATELDEYQKSAIMTGNALGLTVDRVSAMSAEMSKMSDVTRGEAAAALTEVAKSGKIASDQIESVATVAARSAKLLGRETSEVVQEFASLADKPAEAAAKLNEQYHFLSASVYEQIKALEEQGRTQEAASLAQETLARASIDRLNEVEKSLGWIESAWNEAGAAAKKAWDFMADIGRPTTTSDILNAAASSIQRYEQTLASLGVAANATEEDIKRMYMSGSDRTAALDAVRGIAQALAAQADAQAKAAGADFMAGAKAWSAEENQKRIDAINEWGRLTERNLSKQAQAEKDIAKIREAGVAAGKTELQIEAAIAAYREKHKEKGRAGPKRKILYNDLDDLIASPKVQQNLADYERQLSSIENLIGDRLTTAQQKYAHELESMGQGDWARRVGDELQSIEERYNRIIEQRRTSAQGLSEADEAALRAAMDRELEMATDFYDRLKEKQGSWLLGASDGLANYADDAANVYRGMESLATKSFQGMTDALTAFVTTGKLSFSDLANSIISDMVRIAIQQSITGPLAGGLGGSLRMFGAETFANMSSDPIGSLIGSLGGPEYSAKGNIYSSPDLSRYSGGIYDRPTLFQFAKGAGVFGEAGPEAIMPLKRGPDGRLGVSTQGSGGVGDVTVNITNVGGQPMQAAGQPKVSIDSMGRMFIDLVVENITRHGQVAKAIEGRYGLR